MTYQYAQLEKRKLAFEFCGTEGPTVVLETGLLAESADWEIVFSQIKTFASVFRYDRAGRGLSDPGPLPRTAQNTAEDLYLLLTKARIPGPYLLVGQSFGGMVVRVFAAHHPDETFGLVLVDSTHERQFETLSALFPIDLPEDPPAIRRTRNFWRDGFWDPSNNAEGIDFPASIQQITEMKTPGDLPILILTAGNSMAGFTSNVQNQHRLQQCHNQLQAGLCRLSTQSRQIILPEAGHFIQRDEPAAIANSVREIVKAHTTPKTGNC